MSITRTTARPKTRSGRLGLRATLAQETVLRRAAAVSHKSLTDFVLESACQAAEQTLLDQRLFMVADDQADAFLSLLESPATENSGLRDLFAKPAPWNT